MNLNTKEDHHQGLYTVSLITNKILLLNNLTQFTITMLGRFLFKSVFLKDRKNTYHKQIFLRFKASTSINLQNNNLNPKKEFKFNLIGVKWKDVQLVNKPVMWKDMIFQMFQAKTECRTCFCTTKIDLHSN